MLIKIRQIITASMFFALSTLAYATGDGFYFGMNLGETNTNNKSQTFITGGDPDEITVTPSNTGFGERIFLGYNFNQYGAFESGLTHYGASTYSVPTTVATNNPEIREGSFDMVGKGMYPFGTTGFAVFLKAGFGYIWTSSSGAIQEQQMITTGSSSASEKAFRPLIGAGVSYDLSPSWVLDLSDTMITSGGGVEKASFIALGISYHFVDKYCGQFLC